MRPNWCTAQPPPRMARSSTRTWPASMTLLDMMMPSPRMQSWATCELARSRQLLPTTVLPPPPTVPVLMVTPSRMVQPSPTVSVEPSPASWRLWEVPPITAIGKILLPRPISVLPVTTAWEITCTSSFSTTWAPMVQNGPTDTFSPITAPSSITAIGWMRAVAATVLMLPPCGGSWRRCLPRQPACHRRSRRSGTSRYCRAASAS